jgi:hypothetical protein
MQRNQVFKIIPIESIDYIFPKSAPDKNSKPSLKEKITPEENIFPPSMRMYGSRFDTPSLT